MLSEFMVPLEAFILGVVVGASLLVSGSSATVVERRRWAGVEREMQSRIPVCRERDRIDAQIESMLK